jgi:hypothetical protein
MPNENIPSYLEISCHTLSASRVLNFCRHLTMLLNGHNVKIRAPHVDDSPGFNLRLHLRKEAVEHHWPAIQSQLRTDGLLDQCTAQFHSPEQTTAVQLWPPSDE